MLPCRVCGLRARDASDFWSSQRGVCRPCWREYMRAYMAKRRSRPGWVEARRDSRERLALRTELARELGGRCVGCGWEPATAKQWSRLHFHHIDPASKAFTVAHRLANGSVESLRAETAKCELRCPKCHTAEHGGSPVSDAIREALAGGEAWHVMDLGDVLSERFGKPLTPSVRAILHVWHRKDWVEKVAPATYRIVQSGEAKD